MKITPSIPASPSASTAELLISSFNAFAESSSRIQPLLQATEAPTPQASPSHLTEQQIAALRALRSALANGPSHIPTPSELVAVLQLANLAYLRAFHPCRSSLLADHLLIASSIGLQDSNHSDELHLQLSALSSLIASSNFTSIPFTQLVVRVLSGALQHATPVSISAAFQSHRHLFDSVLSVATSNLFPTVAGHIAAGIFPKGFSSNTYRSTFTGISLTVTNSPLFKATVSFAKNGVSIAMDKPTFRTVSALLLESPEYIGRSYPLASFSSPSPGRRSLLRIGSLAVQCTPSNFRALQSLVAEANSNPQLTAWRDLRQSLFGDL